MLVPLAAKAASPESAAGIFSGGMVFHDEPPSAVRMIMKRPSTFEVGSPNAMPLVASQNAKPSRKHDSLSSAR